MSSNLPRLTSRDQGEIEDLILDDLLEYGPSVSSDIYARLRHRLNDQLLAKGLKALVAGGRASFVVKEFVRKKVANGVERRYPFKARQYAAARGRKPAKPAKPQQIAPKSPSAKTVEAKQARRDERKALVLADVSANGPSRFRQITLRLNGRVNEIDVRRYLKALESEGLIRAEVRMFEELIPHGEGKRATKYRATIYSLAGG